MSHGRRLHVTQDKDGWYQIALKGKPLPHHHGFENLYRTRTGALAGIRAIRRQPGGERSAESYVR